MGHHQEQRVVVLFVDRGKGLRRRSLLTRQGGVHAHDTIETRLCSNQNLRGLHRSDQRTRQHGREPKVHSGQGFADRTGGCPSVRRQPSLRVRADAGCIHGLGMSNEQNPHGRSLPQPLARVPRSVGGERERFLRGEDQPPPRVECEPKKTESIPDGRTDHDLLVDGVGDEERHQRDERD